MYHPDKRVMICGNQLGIAIEIMDRIRLGYEYCPSAIKIGVTTYNKQCIEFENNSTIRCFATGSSSTRGFSANLLVLDEAAFIPKHVADEFMASVFPVLSSSKDSKAIMVSTPNGTYNNLFYDTWQQATDPNIESTENWKAFRFLWYDVPGRDEEWKRQQIATIGMNRWLQEFECEFKSAGDASLVPSDDIEHFRINLKNYPEPAKLNLSKNPEKDIFAYFWKPFDPTRVYAGSGDISEGTGNDSSVMFIWDVTEVRNIQLVARMSCSKATLVDFGYATYEFMKLYGFPPLIFENNGVGAGFVDIMLDTYQYPKYRMFYEQAISPTGKYGELTYGVKSKNKTKLEACMFTNELITTEEINISIPDELLVNEMGTFVRKNTSNSITFAAKDKCHDDYMLSWIWGMYLLFPDTIQQHYAVVKAFKTKMDRVLPDVIQYSTPLDKSMADEILNSEAHKSIVSQLGNLEEYKPVKIGHSERDIPDDELFYGNRQWGHGMNRQFFAVNQSFDFMNGTDWED